MQNILLRGSQGEDVRLLRQALIKQMGDDATDFAKLANTKSIKSNDDVLDADVEAAARRWQAGVGLVADGVIGPYCQTVFGLRPEPKMALVLTADSVRKLFPATKPANIARYLPYVSAALHAMGLTDRLMICAALGSFDNDVEVISKTLERIRDGKLLQAVDDLRGF